MAAKKVYILDCGSLVLDRSHILWGMEPGTPTRFPAYGVLIDHPDGPIVYDTGFDLDHVSKAVPFGLPEQTPEQTIPAQLASAGFHPEQVSLVVNSHLHFDHSGGNKHLTNATILVSKEEMRHARAPEPFEQLGYCDPGFDHPQAKYQQISGDIEIADGVWLYETPGHSAGHYSLLVEMEGQPSMLFAGDAAYTYANIEQQIPSGIHLDPTAALESIHRLTWLARSKSAQIYPSHEMEPFKTWKKAPYFY